MMTKNSLRKLFRQRRRELTEEQYKELNVALFHQFIAEADLSRVSTLHVFLPIYKNREPDTWLIINYLRTQHPHIRLVVPRIDAATFDMDCLLLNEDTNFIKNQYGISEPDGEDKVMADEIDMVIVPLLAFDRRGYRVGYGKGYYDRFFATCRTDTIKAGLSFFEPVETISDTDAYDVPLDVALTPGDVYRFS